MRAIITGAASGIGRATALRFARDAATGVSVRLLLVDTNASGLDAVVDQVAARGGEAIPMTADLAEPTVAEAIVATAATALGGLDALVSNAGYFPRDTTLADMSITEYDRMFAVNTRATWLLAKHSRPMLAAARGAIVATASISAREPTPAIGNYSATKAALVMVIRQLAYELGPEGIRCNCVSPGTTRTGINDFLLSDDRVRAAREALLPLRRIGQPDDLASAIAFLTGPDAAYITGVDLLVDGGLNTMLMPGLGQAGQPDAR
jgi:NAD(P)-dependent dehydrogenase (short-subunit alcohol dehydrogenase family)